jgi:hypothetical protein
MLYDTGRQSRNAGSFPRKELGEALRIGPNFFPRLNAPILRRLTAPPAGRALRCSLDVQAMLTQEPGSEILCRSSACGRGLLLFVMQHWRHKSKSRNADYILIAATGGDTFPSEPLLYRTIHSILSVLNREINKHHRCSHESCQRCELGAFEAQGQCAVVSPEVFQEET